MSINQSPSAIAKKIRDGRYKDSHNSLAEVFLSLLPSSIKKENDQRIEMLFIEVKKCLLFNSKNAKTFDVIPEQHWVLL